MVDSGSGPREMHGGRNRTLCFSRSSLLKGALIIVRRWLEGAEKCALRDFRREVASAVCGIGVSIFIFLSFILANLEEVQNIHAQSNLSID
jgi:hypothetical protein